jgi:hypothetical protein
LKIEKDEREITDLGEEESEQAEEKERLRH